MRLIKDFAERIQLTPMELISSARPQLENLGAEFIAAFPSLGGNHNNAIQQTQAKYRGKFHQRIDHALRDIEIGFIGGRNVLGQSQKTIQANALRLLQAMEEATRGQSTPVVVPEGLRNLVITEEEAKAAFNYLRTAGLIQANFGLKFAAVISAQGHDALRDAQRAPDQPSRAFPEITYNYLHVETMIGSNVQQGATNSKITAAQTVTTGQLVARVRDLITQVERALPTSDLATVTQEQARAALVELREATGEQTPDAGRIRPRLEALKRIMEGAAGNLVAGGVLGLIEPLLQATIAH